MIRRVVLSVGLWCSAAMVGLPAGAGAEMARWDLDPDHSIIEFRVAHMVVSKTAGKFMDYTGVVEMDADAHQFKTIEASINTASVNTNHEKRDAHLRNADFFELEVDKLDSWADDLKVGLEREIKEFDRHIKEARKAAIAALTLEEKLAGQKQIKALEAEMGKRRRALFDAQDDIDRRREQLIAEVEGKLQQKVSSQQLLVIRWTLDS